jgi:adenylyl-sulfate kinase
MRACAARLSTIASWAEPSGRRARAENKVDGEAGNAGETSRGLLTFPYERGNGRVPESSRNVTWQEGRLTRNQRWSALDATGATVWLTGLPASGKSTIGGALEEAFVSRGKFAYLLDGDNLRHGLCSDLGFSAGDRARNVARAGELARLFADAGGIAVVAMVSPFADARDQVREHHAASGLRFVEVYVDTPLDVCESRDPKGLYARARAGELHGLTGIDDPYEPPTHPDLRVSDQMPVSAAVDAVLGLLGAELRTQPQGAN